MDADILAERILLDLSNTFKKDPLIDEFDILPLNDSVCNKCPVIHIEHKVALEGWCVKHVYLYAYSNLLKWRQHRYKADPEALLSWTRAVLLINPDIQTAWNVRKELISSNAQDVKEELKFSEVVLSRKPKSPEVFAHRKWLLMEFMKSQPSQCLSLQVIEHEFSVCTQVADRYSNNYYAWGHRMWVIEKLINSCLKVVLGELQVTEQWVSTHVSDHSGFHYRQFLISCCTQVKPGFTGCSAAICPLHGHTSFDADLPKSCANSLNETNGDSNNLYHIVLQKEFKLLSELILAFLGHETLWNHRRFIIYAAAQVSMFPKLNSLVPNCTAYAGSEDTSRYKKYKLESCHVSFGGWSPANEEEFVHQCLHIAKGNEWEQNLISKHIQWLQKTVMWSDGVPHIFQKHSQTGPR